MKRNLRFLLALSISASVITATAGDLYVKATGTGDGSTWAQATTLDAALAAAQTDDVIHIAAGTYIPTVEITNTNEAITLGEADKTFEISKNITLIGGYPADAETGAVANPSENPTILSGLLTADPELRAYHVVVVSAPATTDKKVVMKGLTIEGGQAFSANQYATTNEINYHRNYGGGMFIGGAIVEMENCTVKENSSTGHSAGIFICSGAIVTMEKCLVSENNGITVAGCNGGGIWVNASTLYLKNSKISDNQTTGVGAGVYTFSTNVSVNFSAGDPAYLYAYNTTFSGNKTGGANAAAGYYGRERTVAQIINCTFYGNVAGGHAGAIQTYGTATDKPVIDIINSTFTGNICGASNNGGGININGANATVNIYNSIISGNKKGEEVNDLTGAATLINKCIITDKVYDETGAEVPSLSFDATTMFGAFQNNGGGLNTCLLTGENNPAISHGMSSADLTTLANTFTPAIPNAIISFDQLGTSRETYSTMGAVVKAVTSGNGSITSKEIRFYVSGNTLFVPSQIGDDINVYSISGQLVRSVKADSEMMRIEQLAKGSIYIVKVANQAFKVIL